jgi:glycine dehydrogenase
MNIKSLFDRSGEFSSRHNGPRKHNHEEMLKTIGASSLEELVDETIPSSIRLKNNLSLAQPLTEEKYLEKIRKIADKNDVFDTYIGLGYNPTILPSVILRNVLENPGWYTQYTPYQSEISQGRLEALLNYQTVITDLTGLPLANASLLDEATAAAEAMHFCKGIAPKSKKKATKFFVSKYVFPQTLEVIQTRAEYLGYEIIVGDCSEQEMPDDIFGMIIQYPAGDGKLYDYEKLVEKAHANDISVVVAADLLSLSVLKAPAEFGADVVVGSAQRLGVPMGYGGPHAGFFATKEEFKRHVPGRIIGVSVDAEGDQAYRMALQTREQHIRRDKATSNICTAQALLANMAGMYAVYHGPEGLKNIATRIHVAAEIVSLGLETLGFEQENKYYFDTLRIKNANAKKIREVAESKKINFRYFKNGDVGISVNETTDFEKMSHILSVFEEVSAKTIELDSLLEKVEGKIPENIKRNTEYLTSDVFNKYHSETDMMRYLKYLENKDLSLTLSMIPLGSCTMKLNAATEMIPVTWPEFANLHPFIPQNQAKGYHELFEELETQLCEITGFDAFSLQPNAGAQGEYAGLLVIRKYQEDLGEGHRNIALIPSSAHGTNPASAVMAGMKVVVVKTDEMGNIDLEDLKAKAEKHSENLSALMITYPSTHGVFEEAVMEVCDIIHKHGGQVYMDGANMNAQVGLTSPAMIGADVCHLNLHKTFAIPHGGGGPGVGPIGVAKHLTPFLPSHSVVTAKDSEKAMNAVSAAPWGSASIMMISHSYISMLGENGLTYTTKNAMLNANYIASRLKDYYPLLYVGEKGRVAHECIFDTRIFKADSGVEVEDIAKRLMDYGFHAPTVSFPVPGTLMVEPTESESKAELDRFCEAMIEIRKEIQEIADGKYEQNNNVLKNAPHTQSRISRNAWDFKYSREKAAFPLAWVKERKFWPSVARVNNALGDRELVCTCPPLESYEN